VFIFASVDQLDTSHKVTIVGAVQGERTVYDAIVQARGLINQIKPHFKMEMAVKKNQVLATYTAPWGASVKAVAKDDVKFISGPGVMPSPTLSLDNIVWDLPHGSQVGLLKIGGASSQVITNSQLAAPSWQWRVFSR
jgi:hypothetical protein